MKVFNKLSGYLALEGNIRILALQTFVSQIGFGMMYTIWQPYMLSIGLSGVWGHSLIPPHTHKKNNTNLVKYFFEKFEC